MKILHREIESCMSCPYMSIVGGEEDGERMTVVACKNRQAVRDHPLRSKHNAMIILEQPMNYVLAEVAIPEWCPLPDGDES